MYAKIECLLTACTLCLDYTSTALGILVSTNQLKGRHLCDSSADREGRDNRSAMPTDRYGQAVHVAMTYMTRRATTQVG